MNESEELSRLKPIVDVKNSLHAINKLMNEMKVDLIYVKSDLKEIKEIIKEKEKIEKMGGGWWIY